LDLIGNLSLGFRHYYLKLFRILYLGFRDFIKIISLKPVGLGLIGNNFVYSIMKKIIFLSGFVLIVIVSFWLSKPDWSEAAKVVFKRNVVFRSFYALTQNGSAGNLVEDYTFYTKDKGGVDDYNNGGTIPPGSYSASWTDCVAGNNYCGTGDSNADAKDNSTGLIWSNLLDSGTDHTWFWANNCYEPGTAENPGSCVNNGDDACQCVKKDTSKVGCEALNGNNWRLPHQKELMLAYIDGSYVNLSNSGYYVWSATTISYNPQYAWYAGLDNGYVYLHNKTDIFDSRCVR
jgi:hypothetical protein